MNKLGSGLLVTFPPPVETGMLNERPLPEIKLFVQNNILIKLGSVLNSICKEYSVRILFLTSHIVLLFLASNMKVNTALNIQFTSIRCSTVDQSDLWDPSLSMDLKDLKKYNIAFW